MLFYLIFWVIVENWWFILLKCSVIFLYSFWMVRSLVDGLLGKKLKVNDKIDLIILRYGLIDEMSLDVVLEKF